MKPFRFLSLVVLIASILLTGCQALERMDNTVEGSGEVIVEKRDLPAFNKIEAHGDFELYITQLNEGVEVHAESNLIKYIRTRVENQTLIVDVAGPSGNKVNLKPLEPIRVYVKLVRIQGVTLSDGVIMTSSQLVAEDARIDLTLSSGSWGYVNAVRTGTLNVTLSDESELQVIDGQVDEQHIVASGGSHYTADWLKSNLTDVQLGDSSEATIWAVDTFNVDLSGGSTAYYYGSPVEINEVRSSGGSDYISRGEH